MPPFGKHTKPGHPETEKRGRRLIGAAILALSIASLAVPSAHADKGPQHPEPTLETKPHDGEPIPEPLKLSDKEPVAKPPGAGTNIVGGSPAVPGEFPYFVSLQGSTGGTGDFFCGGSLLSTTRVLTAAHCVNGSSPASLQVTIGGTTLSGSNVGVVRNIRDVRVHPAYNPTTFENDVAMLTLATPITRNDSSVQWLRLAQGNELGLVDPGDPATVIGHGSLCTDCVSSNDLLKVSVPIQSDSTMSSLFGTAFRPATMLGAGPTAGGRDSCQGDSGGPLVITSPAQDIQIGDVSVGSGCAQPNRPGIYGELYQGAMATFVNGEAFRPGNDAFGRPSTLGGNTGSRGGTLESATVEPGEPAGGETTLWYEWTPSASGIAQIAVNQHGFDSEVDVYTGNSLSGLRLVAHNDDANGTLQSEVEFNAVAGTNYRIRVDGFNFDFGEYRISYGVNRPPHDDFVNSRVISGAFGTELTNNSASTGEAGEPGLAFGSADATLWYSWTAPESGTARFSTSGTLFDTTLGAFVGTSFPGLGLVAFNDDFNGAGASQISFPVSAGTVYRIQVGGYGGSTGDVTLSFAVNPPANDLFATAEVITGSSGTVFGSNARAVAEPGEPSLGSTPDSSVWYRWTAPFTGSVQFRTCGSNFDTVLAAATGTSITGLTSLASNDDSACGLQSTITFNATAGTTYHLWIDGFSVGRGNIQLSWN